MKRVSNETLAGRRYLDLQREAKRTGRPTDELIQLANTHRLPEVRRMAIASLEALSLPRDASTPALEPSKRSIFYDGSERGDFVDVYVLDDLTPCVQKEWKWQSIDFRLPDRRAQNP